MRQSSFSSEHTKEIRAGTFAKAALLFVKPLFECFVCCTMNFAMDSSSVAAVFSAFAEGSESFEFEIFTFFQALKG